MSTQMTTINEIRQEFAPIRSELAPMLPSHITPERFIETIVVAVERDPALVLADRQSLFIAAKEAASDGLLPDKKEGAFVIYKTKKMVPTGRGHAKEEKWVDEVKWMPMILGIRKKMFQTNAVKDVIVELVYEHDVYRRTAGDNGEIVHEPLDFGDRGKMRGVYAIIALMNGGVFREVMSLEQIEAVEKVSKSDKVWKGPFRSEMIRKTVLRRLAKQVPLSKEVDQVLSRDDAMYDFNAIDGTTTLLAIPKAPAATRGLFGNRAKQKRVAAPVEDAVVEEIDQREPEAEQPAAKKAAGEPFVLHAILTRKNGLQEFDDIEMWQSDIEQMAKRISGGDRVQFWAANDEHIHAAAAMFPEEAAKLFALRDEQLGIKS